MTNLLIYPIIIPLLAAILGMLMPKSRVWQGSIGVGSSVLLLLTAFYLAAMVQNGEILTLAVGQWQPPFGIVLVADMLSAVMLCLTAIIAFATHLYACADIDRERIAYGFFPLLNFLTCGICGAFLTGDLFNLYVWFEVMLIASFALLSLGGERRQLFGTIKYVSLNLIATLLLISAIGILYGLTGTVNMADVAQKVALVENKNLVTVTALLFLVAFGIKAAVFPLFFWLPASYHMPPVTVSAIFAGLLTKVGVYAMYRVMTLIFIHDISLTHGILAYVAGLTMVVGVLGASVQVSMRRIFSYSVISAIGFMVLGLSLMTKLALVAGVFYIIHDILVKANLFFVGGLMRNLTGGSHILKVGGLYKAAPWLAVLFMVPALSLAGVPPFSGFWAKLGLVMAALEREAWGLVFVALFAGLFTLYAMMRMWLEVFWKPHPEHKDVGFKAARYNEAQGLFMDPNTETTRAPTRLQWVFFISPCVLLSGLTLWLGLSPQPIFNVAELIAQQLLDPQIYIQAVLGGHQS